jgi:hypothetical protein
MEEALMARLLATGAITAIYGQRIHFQTRPAGDDVPALTVSVVSDPRMYNHDAPDDLQEVRLQFDSRAATYLQAKQGIRAVLSEMEKIQEGAGWHFEEGRKVGGGDAPKETLGGGTEVFRITMDILVQVRQIA